MRKHAAALAALGTIAFAFATPSFAQERTVKITGFSGQFDTHYEIIPRFQSDITILAG